MLKTERDRGIFYLWFADLKTLLFLAQSLNLHDIRYYSVASELSMKRGWIFRYAVGYLNFKSQEQRRWDLAWTSKEEMEICTKQFISGNKTSCFVFKVLKLSWGFEVVVYCNTRLVIVVVFFVSAALNIWRRWSGDKEMMIWDTSLLKFQLSCENLI